MVVGEWFSVVSKFMGILDENVLAYVKFFGWKFISQRKGGIKELCV